MDQASMHQRAKWVERWKDSGLTAKEFAAEAGLKATALYYWRSQLSSAERKGSESRDESAEQSGQSRQSRGIVGAKLLPEPAPFYYPGLAGCVRLESGVCGPSVHV
jgi:transposase-like protein